MLEYILIAVLAGIFLLLLLTYFINSKKIQKKAKAKEKSNDKPKEKSKTDEKKDPNEKVEVPSVISSEKPVEKAIKEANAEYHIKEAFEIIEQERIAYENSSRPSHTSSGRLKLDRGEFKSELQKSLEQNVISSDTNVISSATAKMDYEMSSQQVEQNSDVEKQIAEDYMKSHTSKNGSLADEIVNLSPEAKAILLNDVLNKKYWYIENIKKVKHKISKRCFVFDFFNDFFDEIKKGAFRYQVNGGKGIVVEGYKNVLKIETNSVVLKLNNGELEIFGTSLKVKEIGGNSIVIEGKIQSVNQVGERNEK